MVFSVSCPMYCYMWRLENFCSGFVVISLCDRRW